MIKILRILFGLFVVAGFAQSTGVPVFEVFYMDKAYKKMMEVAQDGDYDYDYEEYDPDDEDGDGYDDRDSGYEYDDGDYDY